MQNFCDSGKKAFAAFARMWQICLFSVIIFPLCLPLSCSSFLSVSVLLSRLWFPTSLRNRVEVTVCCRLLNFPLAGITWGYRCIQHLKIFVLSRALRFLKLLRVFTKVCFSLHVDCGKHRCSVERLMNIYIEPAALAKAWWKRGECWKQRSNHYHYSALCYIKLHYFVWRSHTIILHAFKVQTLEFSLYPMHHHYSIFFGHMRCCSGFEPYSKVYFNLRILLFTKCC